MNILVQDQFWSKVAFKQFGCWEWLGKKRNNKYGYFKQMGAHRFAWSTQHGDISKGMFICHHCDNPSCVNPDHLFLGTRMDNIQDMLSKERHYCQTPDGLEVHRKRMHNLHLGKKMSEEVKQKISKTHSGKKLSENHKRKIGEAGKGRKMSEAHKQKLLEMNLGKIVSEETKRKMSESQKGKILSEETKRKISKSMKSKLQNGGE
jgi:hypothetical protein